MRSRTELFELFFVTQHGSQLQVVHFKQHGRYSKSCHQFHRGVSGLLGITSLLSSIFSSTVTLPRLKGCCSVKTMVRAPFRPFLLVDPSSNYSAKVRMVLEFSPQGHAGVRNRKVA
jgi:hypothetical protein